DGGVSVVSTPRPHGPTLARWAVLLAIGIMVWEVVLAWRMGPSRLPGASAKPVEKHLILRVLANVAAFGVLLVVTASVVLVIRADRTGNVFGFLPQEMKN